MRNRFVTAVAVLVAATVLIACDPPGFGGPQDLAPAFPVFQADLFEQNLVDTFGSQSVGFTYAIAVGGHLQRSGALGSATLTPDANRAMHVTDRMHVASISKTVTTIAALRALQDIAGTGLNTSFAQYLPAGWSGTGVGALTFGNLLRHESGFDFPSNQSRFYHNDLRSLITAGVVGDTTVGVYNNSHHSLLRVIIPNMIGASQESNETEEEFYARAFAEYVDSVIFSPLDINASIQPPPTPNLYYAFPHNAATGLGTGADWTYTLDPGGYGWYLSALDLVKILVYLHETEDLISAAMRTAMNQDEMGYWNSRTGDHGRYLLKSGSWGYTVDSVTQGVQSIAGRFPYGVSAAVIVNSRTTPALNMANLIRDAYDAAFE